jgi:hypothetical protein
LLRRLAVSVLLLAPAAAAAEPMKLGASEIKDTFTGSRVELDTPLGTTIPVQFTDDGLMSGTAGSLASVLGAPKDRGRWWVKDDRLCTKWFRWFDAEEQCLTIHLKDERVFWRRADGKKGTATIVERPVVITEPAKPAPAPVKETGKQAFATATLAAAPKPQVKPPVLKAGPRLATRAKSAAEQLGLPPEAPADRSLFFVGMGLARALQSQFAIASAEAAPVSKPKTKSKPLNAAQPSRELVTAAVVAKPQASLAKTSPAPLVANKQAVQAAPTALSSFRVYGVADDDVLNVRSGPSEGHAVVGNIPPNASTVRMVGGCVALWCEIQFRSTRGWVNRYYLAQN